MWTFLIIFLFVFSIGFAIGGLLAGPRVLPPFTQLFIMTGLFLLFAYAGMFVGVVFPPFISFGLVDFFLAISCILVVVSIITCFHPIYGFFPPNDKKIIFLLCVLFFLMGFQWGVIGYRTFFTLCMTVVFFIAASCGLFVQIQIRQKLWRFAYISFVPLVWLLFVTLFKLL
ncbi:hypothetical protein [Alkalicoccobacillus murimartini]|uniref:Prepilin type IV endopeptidase peptidase domain-containing protein n=1 Tax=Alkalicoccobacillus murimartini TaxID=171685 RepID=A0ABT9YCZ4_9BACI|nr:hypothetical protein [Alkalicoccobacillus murimartini]MDQ0205599.1 hypothetical protein [Alkalicoccobacillus murimartini]